MQQTPESPRVFGTMEEVLEAIPPQVPDVFKQQAKIAAEFITRLDHQEALTDPKLRIFVEQLSHTGFRALVYFHNRSLFGKQGPDPKDALPTWLQNEWLVANNVFREKSLAQEEVPMVQSLFDNWVKTQGMNYRVGPNGTHFALDSSHSQVPKTRTFKCYVEDIDLLEALQQEKFPALFGDLKTLGVNPDEMKLFEGDRLVLYYTKDITLAERIRGAFAKHAVYFRGPAQDVQEVNVDDQGILKTKEVTSNDGALGEGGHTPIRYKVRRYTSPEFLDNYLQFCLWAGKDPSESYKTSFVYFIDWEGRAKNNLNNLIQKASEIAQYPILYTDHRLHVARK